MWDAPTNIQTALMADGRQRAMGFCIGTTTTLGLTKDQQRFVLGQTMVCIVGL